jgi:hypothetical protein
MEGVTPPWASIGRSRFASRLLAGWRSPSSSQQHCSTTSARFNCPWNGRYLKTIRKKSAVSSLV